MANLVFFVVNRQKETEHKVEFVNSYPENKGDLHYSVFIQLKENSLQCKVQNDTRTANCIEHFFVATAAIRDIHRHTLHNIHYSFNPGINWKLFLRPPPCKRL